MIGRNGSGKSTLLQLIAGTLTPTTGDVQIDGRVAALLELGGGLQSGVHRARERVHERRDPRPSAPEMERRFDDITAFRRHRRLHRPAGQDLLERHDRPTRVRGGHHVDPDILVIDEALAVGDASFQFKCLERLDTLTKSGVTLLFVSHSMDMIKTFCNHVVYLQRGSVRAAGPPEEMAERYFFDLRAEQQKPRGGAPVVTWKEPLYSSGQAAFGTEDGRIVSAAFAGGGGQHSGFLAGAEIAIVVESEYRSTVGRPHLSIMLQDRRMLQIGGRAFALSGTEGADGMVRARVQFSFAAKLARGRYFVTLRLEERRSEDLFFPLDKQTGLMSFEVMRQQRDFLGTVDLDMQCSEIPLSSP